MGGWNFPPVGWVFCDGSLLPISEQETLFQLIGTTYGGDGQENFAVPDLRGRVPIHQGGVFSMGETGGVESVTITTQSLPTHNHPMTASQDQGTLPDPGNNVLGRTNTPGVFMYVNDAPDVQLAANSVSPVGGSQPHENMAPFQVITYIISLYGIFPSQT